MPSPFHQKYSTQNHRVFHSYPDADPTQQNQLTQTTSNDSTSSSSPSDMMSSPTSGRRTSGSAFDAFSALKRPSNPDIDARRTSLSEHKPAAGLVGGWWNSAIRGTNKSPPLPKDAKDTTTLSQ